LTLTSFLINYTGNCDVNGFIYTGTKKKTTTTTKKKQGKNLKIFQRKNNN
jgi:hypothetical protein